MATDHFFNIYIVIFFREKDFPKDVADFAISVLEKISKLVAVTQI